MSSSPIGVSPRQQMLVRLAEAEIWRRQRVAQGNVPVVIRDFTANSEGQAAALRFETKGCLVLGGNRAGKTVLGAVETVWRHLGRHPYKPVHAAPIHSWCISQMLPGSTDKPHVQVEEIRRWAPAAALRGGSWATAYSAGARTLVWADGGVTEFKSYDQTPLQFEAAKLHWIWFDEEPPLKSTYTSCLLRLVDYRGQWLMTLTPILSLQGAGWVEELWEGRAEGLGRGDYETHQLFTSANTALDQGEVERTMASLTDEEKSVRAYGAFARLGGRVLSEFDPARHLADDFLPPATWRHFLVIDPGWNTAAHLFAAVDPEGTVWLWSEIYGGQRRPAEWVRALNALWRSCYPANAPRVRVLMDPAGLDLKRTTTGRESPSDADEYAAAARALGADWLRIAGADNGDAMAWRVKRYLALDRMKVCRSLRWWLWEQERWTRQKERKTLAALEHPVPDAPIDRFNHLMDCTRYLANELPEPLPAEKPFEVPFDQLTVGGVRHRRRQDPNDPLLTP